MKQIILFPALKSMQNIHLIAEGARGSITKLIEQKLSLRKNSDPQKYGLGFKEIWRLKKEKHKPWISRT
jgi:electron-transferring-flavoprotein dehydrogenase